MEKFISILKHPVRVELQLKNDEPVRQNNDIEVYHRTCVLCGEASQETELLNCLLCQKNQLTSRVGPKEATQRSILWSCDKCRLPLVANITFELSELKVEGSKLQKVGEMMDVIHYQVNQPFLLPSPQKHPAFFVQQNFSEKGKLIATVA